MISPYEMVVSSLISISSSYGRAINLCSSILTRIDHARSMGCYTRVEKYGEMSHSVTHSYEVIFFVSAMKMARSSHLLSTMALVCKRRCWLQYSQSSSVLLNSLLD